jgi:hypothetical protein
LKLITISLFIALTITSAYAATPVDWVVGDVFVAVGSGNYQVWHSANPAASKPSYANIQTLNDGVAPVGSPGGATAGCTFDSAYRLFTTNFTNSEVVRFSIDGTYGPISDAATSGLTQSESVAFDGQGNFYVGYAGTGINGSGAGLAKFSHDGGSPEIFSPSPTIENSGVDWIDLASDGETIFYTSEGRKIFTFNTTSSVSSVYADLSTLSGVASSGKLFAIRILPPGNASGSGGVLVADQSNVKLVKASASVITSVQIFKFNGESNLQALSLDPTNPARFWVGDATTHDLIQFDMSTGKKVVTLNTGTALGGVCVDGGFSAAQNVAPHVAQTFPTPVTPTNNTVFFNTLTGGIFMATLANLPSKASITVTLHDSLVDPSIAKSDATVYSFNPGNPGTPINGSCPPGSIGCSFSGPLPCEEQTVTINQKSVSGCEVFEFEANPPLDTSVISNVQVCPSSDCAAMDIAGANPRLLRNLDEDITTGVNTLPLSGSKSNCVYTVNDLNTAGAQSCGFQSPSQGQTFTKTQGASIPFKFVAASNGVCPPSTSTALGAGAIIPMLMITQLAPLDPKTDQPTTAPVSETVIVKGNSGGFPIFTFSGNTWQLQVDTSNLPVGNYLATVIDLSDPKTNPNAIPAFGVNFSLR